MSESLLAFWGNTDLKDVCSFPIPIGKKNLKEVFTVDH